MSNHVELPKIDPPAIGRPIISPQASQSKIESAPDDRRRCCLVKYFAPGGGRKFFQSKIFCGVSGVILTLIVFLLVFKVGIIVGERKAGFSYKWGDNYHQNFGGPREGFGHEFSDRDFMNANGTFGQIIKISLASSTLTGTEIVIRGGHDMEKIILADTKTAVKSFRSDIKVSDLKNDDYIIVIGDANEAGQIAAKLIRLMPAPAETGPWPFIGEPGALIPLAGSGQGQFPESAPMVPGGWR
jgi:hypothetical protein